MQAIMNKKWKLLGNQKGMTLIELLAVVVILGVIAAIAVPAIGGTIQSTKTKADTQSQALIEDAAVRYAQDNNPTGISSGSPVTGNSVALTTLVTDGYLKSQPTPQADTTKVFKVTVTYAATTGWTAATTISAP